jgi:multiple sugar transport system permease protein
MMATATYVHRTPWNLKLKRWLPGYLFSGPVIVWFLAFNFIPIIAGLVLGFYQWDILNPPKPVGFDNFAAVLKDELFWQSMVNTLYYAVASVTLTVALSLGLAMALNQKLGSIALYRTLFFLPAVTATVAVSMVWRWLYNTDYGIFNFVLSLVGIPPLNWLGEPGLAMPAVIVMSVWRSAGFNTIIFLAGLQGIPKEYYEASSLDGAGRLARFRHVTLPLISPTTFFVMVTGLINSWQVFDQVYAMTRGGPLFATTTAVYLIYSNAFEWNKAGYASAMAYYLFVAIMLFPLVQFILQRRWVHYN